MAQALVWADSEMQSRHEQPGAVAQEETRSPVVLVVEKGNSFSRRFAHIFDYLGIRLEYVAGARALSAALGLRQPIAVLTEMDAGRLDGCFVLGLVAGHDPNLPVMVVGDDPHSPALVDATVERWKLTHVEAFEDEPDLQDMVEFLFRASLKSGSGGFMPV